MAWRTWRMAGIWWSLIEDLRFRVIFLHLLLPAGTCCRSAWYTRILTRRPDLIAAWRRRVQAGGGVELNNVDDVDHMPAHGTSGGRARCWLARFLLIYQPVQAEDQMPPRRCRSFTMLVWSYFLRAWRHERWSVGWMVHLPLFCMYIFNIFTVHLQVQPVGRRSSTDLVHESMTAAAADEMAEEREPAVTVILRPVHAGGRLGSAHARDEGGRGRISAMPVDLFPHHPHWRSDL